MTILPRLLKQDAISVLLLAVALVASLFFDGGNIDLLAVVVMILVAILLTGVLRMLAVNELALSRNVLSVSLLLYPAWLAVTILWSPVSFVSEVNFWWLACFPLAYWLYTYMPARTSLWPYLMAAVLIIGAGLAVSGAYQLLVHRDDPRSVFEDVNVHAALLTLIAIPAGGRFLAASAMKKQSTVAVWLFGGVFFLLTYALMVPMGRVAIVSFIVGMGLVIAASAQFVPRRAICAILAMLIAAGVLANFSRDGDVFARLATIADPLAASPERWLIWKQSWALLMQSPWLGAGLGMYPFLWPPYRDPADGSAGYFVHNDYLQIWLEAGIPGLLLMSAIFGVAAWTFVRAERGNMAPDVRIEFAGLSGGLLAIALQSFVQFSFYVLPIAILSGLFLGRLHAIALQARGESVWILRPGRHFSARGLRLIVVLLFVPPLVHLGAIGLSVTLADRGIAAAAEGRITVAAEALGWAARLTPAADSLWLSLADLDRQVLAEGANNGFGTGDNDVRRRLLYRSAEETLDHAQALNPYRAEAHVVRAALYRSAPDLAGAVWARRVVQAYRQALRINPRHHSARLDYARFMLEQGQEPYAQAILEEGMRYTYPNSDAVLPYFLLTLQLHERAGDMLQTQLLRSRIAVYVHMRAEKLTVDPETKKVLVSMGLLNKISSGP